MTVSGQWRKSRRSQSTSTCVEVAGTLDRLRDSKNSDGGVLRGDIRALVRAVRSGELGR
ncbi:MAG TPA: DUF397 domain-containing protein [Pseudonocardiaceae bacterium]|nr:DUF397 domain-containing protein [Pseudonocardiaceae bacterium]